MTHVVFVTRQAKVCRVPPCRHRADQPGGKRPPPKAAHYRYHDSATDVRSIPSRALSAIEFPVLSLVSLPPDEATAVRDGVTLNPSRRQS